MKKFSLVTFILMFQMLLPWAGNMIGAENINSNYGVSTWQFMYSVAKPTELQLQAVESHSVFDKKTEFLYNQLQELCFKRIPVVPGDPTTRIVTRKSELFNAVKRVSKGLEEEMKTHKISTEDATTQLNQVLNVAISAFYSEDSKSFEKALHENKKDYQKLMGLFSQVTLK